MGAFRTLATITLLGLGACASAAQALSSVHAALRLTARIKQNTGTAATSVYLRVPDYP
ncbi:hypothetical protein [Novosphingobium sp. 9U]|uniref:hypothetical protein n=1 Tax=Novosphingobium sp. 9U TaxID=2653158 RepID=UPI0012F16FEE|nr:hypothetical protein [Novosphingobium sp. 9U]VWX54126.1 exported hypothetical protein [Novosphingobium sp. 9U]